MAERPDFGRMLREARERRGVSLRELASTTKISQRVLEALERNDISHLPGGIFGRGFVRSYAVGVGLDPETVIQAFIAQFPHESVTVGHPTSRRSEDDDASESTRKTATTFVRLILVSVPVLGALLYLGTVGRPGVTPAQTPIAAVVAGPSAEPPAAAEPQHVAADVLLPAAARLVVVLTATRACRVTAMVDGDTLVDGRLAAGEQRMLEVRRELVLTVDDGSAITMTLNGEGTKPLGKRREAIVVRVDLANFRDYLLPQ